MSRYIPISERIERAIKAEHRTPAYKKALEKAQDEATYYGSTRYLWWDGDGYAIECDYPHNCPFESVLPQIRTERERGAYKF